MKLGIAALLFWAACMGVLFLLEIETFKLGFFAVILALAIVMALGIKAFLTDKDDEDE